MALRSRRGGGKSTIKGRRCQGCGKITLMPAVCIRCRAERALNAFEKQLQSAEVALSTVVAPVEVVGEGDKPHVLIAALAEAEALNQWRILAAELHRRPNGTLTPAGQSYKAAALELAALLEPAAREAKRLRLVRPVKRSH